MEINFSAGSLSLFRMINSSWTIPGGFLTFHPVNGTYIFLKPQNYDNSSFRLWMTLLYLRTALDFRCVAFTNGEVNISHENTTMVVWIYDGT